MARDPRYRPFRVALWALYLTVIGVSLGVVVTSIVRHLRGPQRPVATGALPTRAALRVCVADLEFLHKEQNRAAWQLGEEVGQADAVQHWETWAREWEQRVSDLSERCRLDARDPDPQGFGGRVELARARDAVLALHRAYRAQVNRFAQEETELARAVVERIDGARAALTRPAERH